MGWNTSADWQSGLDNVGMTEFFKENDIPAYFDGVMSDGNWEVIFHQFCASEFSTENLDFLRAVATFESSGNLNQAAEIYKEFIPQSAPRQVNISSQARDALDAIFGEGGDGEGPPSLFDDAKTEVSDITSRDTFERFKKEAQKAKAQLA